MQWQQINDLSLLQLAEIAEEYVWGSIVLSDGERESLRQTLINRFAQIEQLHKTTEKYPRGTGGSSSDRFPGWKNWKDSDRDRPQS